LPGVRVARVSLLVNGPGAGGVELALPFIEGEAHTVEHVQFDTDVIEANQDIVVGLTHLLGPNTPAGYRELWDDANVWVHHMFGNGESSHDMDFHNRDMTIAGPQRFLVFNGGGAAHEYHATLWYVTSRMALTEWANLATVTSHED